MLIVVSVGTALPAAAGGILVGLNNRKFEALT